MLSAIRFLALFYKYIANLAKVIHETLNHDNIIVAGKRKI